MPQELVLAGRFVGDKPNAFMLVLSHVGHGADRVPAESSRSGAVSAPRKKLQFLKNLEVY
jgi:hypothetical protein